jgi:hypothetical protein
MTRDPRDKDFAMAMTRLIIDTYPELPEAEPKIITGITDVIACSLAGVLSSVMLKHGQEIVEVSVDFFSTRVDIHFKDILQKSMLMVEDKPEGPKGKN